MLQGGESFSQDAESCSPRMPVAINDDLHLCVCVCVLFLFLFLFMFLCFAIKIDRFLNFKF